VLFLDALRHKPHPRILPSSGPLTGRTTYTKASFFTHICHDLPHVETENALPAPIRLAYDGLKSPSSAVMRYNWGRRK
jgi:phosphoribosyl 1,2-cyclic phosphate phosphodiesterase